jgi:hypothetical protein
MEFLAVIGVENYLDLYLVWPNLFDKKMEKLDLF